MIENISKQVSKAIIEAIGKTDQIFIVKTSNSTIKITGWKCKVQKGLRFL